MTVPNIRKIKYQYHIHSIAGYVYAGINMLDNMRAVNVLVWFYDDSAEIAITWGPPAKANPDDIPSVAQEKRPMVYSDGELNFKYTMNSEAPEAAYLAIVRTAARIFSS